MTRKLALCFLLEFSLRVLAFAEMRADDDWKLEYVKFATEKMNPYESEDQEYWSANWSVAAIFFDLDMDGRCDALVATSDQQLDRRFNWLPMRKTRDGSISIDYGRPPCVLAMCDPSAIYLVTLAGGSSLLLGKDCFVERYEESWERVWMERECDLIFRIDEAGGLAPQHDPFMVDKAVANPDFVRLERICPSWYRGYGLHCSPGTDIPEKANPSNGGLPAPADFPAFARRYREEVRRRLGIDRPVTVYAVFLDADDDGDTDFYVSSDAEATGNGKYRWTLCLDDGGSLEKAEDRVWINRGTIFDVGMLEPEDTAGRSAFYRAVRTSGAPQILVMESDGGRLHTHAYMNLLSDDERASRPPWNKYQLKDGELNREEWSDALRRKYGFAPPFDFRDQINGITTFHHLERLPCEEFPEEIGNE